MNTTTTTTTTTTTMEIRVLGMSCSHCEHAVAGALAQLPGVVAVVVDVAAGTATVESRTTLDRMAVGAAIEAAGYESEWAA